LILAVTYSSIAVNVTQTHKKILRFIFGDYGNIELRLALLLAGNVYTPL